MVGKKGDVEGVRLQGDLPPQREASCDRANTLIETLVSVS